MLQNIRDNIQGTMAKIIIAMMLVPFALYGIDFFFTGDSQPTVATVNGKKLTEPELQRAIALQRRQLMSMMGDAIDPGMLDERILRKPALDALVKQQVLIQDAERLGLQVSRGQLNRTIASMPAFQEDGRFSQARFEQVLRAQGFDAALFRELLGTEMLIEQLSAGISGSSFLTPLQKQRVVALGDQKRSYHYIRIPVEGFLDKVSIDQSAIEAYYAANPQRFLTDEEVKLSYIELREAQFYEPVDETVLRDEYEREVAAAQALAERQAAHILIEIGDQRSREEAEAAIADLKRQLDAGADFAELAKKHSEDIGSAEQGGDLGFTAGDTFPDDFERALARLEVGGVSDVVETDAGLHLVKLLDIRAPQVASFEQQRQIIEQRVQSQRARPKFVSAVEQLRDLVFNAPDLTSPAAELGVDAQQIDWAARSDSSGLLAFPAVKQAAFDVELRESGHNSEVFELAPDHYAVIRIEGYRPPATKPLEQVRDQIAETLKRERAAELAEARVAEVLEALQRGDSAEKLAKAAGLEWQVAVRSGRQDTAVPEKVRNQAFSLPRVAAGEGVVTGQVIDDNGDRIAIQLSAVFDGDDSLVAEKRKKELYASALRAGSALSFSAYFSGVLRDADIKYNQ